MAAIIRFSDNPGGGRVIEAGIAFGHSKPVIIIAKHETQIGVPISGIATAFVEYEKIEEIIKPLQEFGRKIAQ